MITECKVCQNEYSTARAHCPTCGAIDIGSLTVRMREVSMVRLVAAKGSMPVTQNLYAGKVLGMRTS